jgi:adenosylcobinamide kinase / adenosylcobinamide-phosphate guanylyltransferase
MAQLTLVVGGVRSGKSRFAEQLAAGHPPVIYLATAQAGDPEMARRIAEHQQRRAEQAGGWRTVEEPWDVVSAVRGEAAAGCVLLECLTLWLTNRLTGLPGRPEAEDTTIRTDIAALAEAGQAVRARVIVVSNETGCGIIPANPLARRFGDLLGEANQRLAQTAAEVYWCVAGIPVRIK